MYSWCFIHAGESRPWALIYLTAEHFSAACTYFGDAPGINRNRDIPRGIPTPWTYLQEGWDTFARTPVAGAIEAAIEGDTASTSAVFHLFRGRSEHLEQKKNQVKNASQAGLSSSIRLSLPASLDAGVYKLAALVNHFSMQQKEPAVLYKAVQHTPSNRERSYLIRQLAKIVADPDSNGLSAKEIFYQRVKKADALAHYKGPDWEKWFIQELEHSLLHRSSPSLPASMGKSNANGSASAVKRYLEQKGVTDSALTSLVVELCRLAGPAIRPVDIVEQWYKVLTACSSHWCRPTLCWCVASTLAMYDINGVTRPNEGGVTAPATCIESWDVLAITRLLQCGLFPDKVHRAVRNVHEHTLRDIAHEQFDCDWNRDWQCLVELLLALDCPKDAAKLREFCESKVHSNDGGAGHPSALLSECLLRSV